MHENDTEFEINVPHAVTFLMHAMGWRVRHDVYDWREGAPSNHLQNVNSRTFASLSVVVIVIVVVVFLFLLVPIPFLFRRMYVSFVSVCHVVVVVISCAHLRSFRS